MKELSNKELLSVYKSIKEYLERLNVIKEKSSETK